MNDIIKNVLQIIQDPEEESSQRIIHKILSDPEQNTDIIISACCASILSIIYEKENPEVEIRDICLCMMSACRQAVESGHTDEVKRKRKELGLE